MKQTTLAPTGFEFVTKRTGKRQFLEEMELVAPRTELLALIKTETVGTLVEQLEKVKAKIRAKVEHPFRLIKCQLSISKTR